jgi:uncharacterized protein (DUF1330 family)
MIRVIATHDVDDVQHWFDSPKRAEFFEARGMKATAFRDPAGTSSTVAVLIETPDMETLEKALAEPEAAEAENHDGVHVHTIRILLAE